MNTAQHIIHWYDSFDVLTGETSELLTNRQRLSVYCVGLAEEISGLELAHKVAYHQRKIKEAEQYLVADGTQQERVSKAIAKELRMEEAQAEGKLKGFKTMLSTYGKVLDSMAGQINNSNRI